MPEGSRREVKGRAVSMKWLKTTKKTTELKMVKNTKDKFKCTRQMAKTEILLKGTKVPLGKPKREQISTKTTHKVKTVTDTKTTKSIKYNLSSNSNSSI